MLLAVGEALLLQIQIHTLKPLMVNLVDVLVDVLRLFH